MILLASILVAAEPDFAHWAAAPSPVAYQNADAVTVAAPDRAVGTSSAVSVGSPPNADADAEARDAFRARSGHVSAFAMVFAEARLPSVPYKIVTAQLPLRRAYAASVTATRVVVPRFDVPLPGVTLRGNALELEGQLLQHFGREDTTEVTGAAVLRSGQFGLTRGLSANVAWGNGLSYTFSDPEYELGPSGIRGVDTVRFQYHMSFETELTGRRNSRMHYVLRLHHRSGIYGIISPSRTGSNYIGVGLRIDLAGR